MKKTLRVKGHRQEVRFTQVNVGTTKIWQERFSQNYDPAINGQRETAAIFLSDAQVRDFLAWWVSEKPA